MIQKKIMLAFALVGIFACPSFSGVLVFDVADKTFLQKYDFEHGGPRLEIELTEMLKQLQPLPRLESVYLHFRIDVNGGNFETDELGCLRVCSFHRDGELSWDTDHATYNVRPGKSRPVVLNVTSLFDYLRRDESLLKKLAVVQCRDSENGMKFGDLDYSSLELRVRYSDKK